MPLHGIVPEEATFPPVQGDGQEYVKPSSWAAMRRWRLCIGPLPLSRYDTLFSFDLCHLSALFVPNSLMDLPLPLIRALLEDPNPTLGLYAFKGL